MNFCSIPPDFRFHSHDSSSSWPGSWDMSRWQDDLKAIWDSGVTGKDVRVAVSDTGGDERHPNIPTAVARRSFVGGNTGDRNGHGTWCIGRVLGRGGVGIAPEADLIVCKVLSDGGSGSTAGIDAARIWAAGEGADVISESLGGPGGDQASFDSIARAYEDGVQLDLASAGNSGYSGRNTIGYPAKFSNTWCNGATRRDGSIATFSSGGREIDDATPGEQVRSCAPGGGWNVMSGTSMSCPFRAGLQALIIHKRRRIGKPSLHGADAWRRFFDEEGFFDDRGPDGKDVRFGLGVPMIKKIIDWLKDPEWF